MILDIGKAERREDGEARASAVYAIRNAALRFLRLRDNTTARPRMRGRSPTPTPWHWTVGVPGTGRGKVFPRDRDLRPGGLKSH